MSLLRSRAVNRLKRRVTWWLPLELLLFVYFSSWLLMIWAEPPESRVVSPDIYWWWFAGTITPAAAGPGEHYPTSTGGHLIGVYVILGGIVAVTTLFTRLARMFDKAKDLRMHGRADVKVNDHVIILGYLAGRTESMIEELIADEPRAIVIGAWDDQAGEHPLAHREDIHFVRGPLTDDEVLQRTAIVTATAVLVDARDDDEALKVTVAVNYANPDVHTVVTLHDLAHARTIAKIAPNAHCVAWHSTGVITEEIQDAGISEVYTELMRHSDRNTYSVQVPSSLADRTFGELQQALGRWNAATILAVRLESGLRLSPSWNDEIPAGATLYYIARRRMGVDDLERHLARADRALVFSDRELIRSEWH